jgi:hypothetical protein
MSKELRQVESAVTGVDASAKAPNANEVKISPEFTKILKNYYAGYKIDEYLFPNSPAKKEGLVKAVNASLQSTFRVVPTDTLHPLTMDALSDLLSGKIGPTKELVGAFVDVFRIYGDEREVFSAAGMRTVADEEARRKAEYLASPEGKAATLAQEIATESKRQAETGLQAARKRIEDGREQWRSNNPEGLKNVHSFQEMLEISHSKEEDFKGFLFKRVLPTWNNMSQVAFCELLGTLNKDKPDIAKPTFTDTILSSWRAGKTKPLRDSVEVMCDAFSIKPAEGELMARHEKMLWKGIDGHPFTFEDKKGVAGIEAAITAAKKSGDTGPLVSELIDSSGIRFERLKDVLQVQQIPQWRHGAKIANVDMALEFLQLVNPQATEEVGVAVGDGSSAKRLVSRQNRDILSLITGREFNIDNMLAEAAQKGNPGGHFLQLLLVAKREWSI